MKCSEFTKNIPDFIDDDLKIEYYDEFVSHARECKDCKEELEIYYMVTVGLNRIEDDTAKSYDIQGELEHQLNRYEDKAEREFKKKIYTQMLIVLAETCGVLTAVLQFLL